MTKIAVKPNRPTSNITIKLLSEKLPKIDYTYFNPLPKKAKGSHLLTDTQINNSFCFVVSWPPVLRQKICALSDIRHEYTLRPRWYSGSQVQFLLNGVVLHALSSPHTVPHHSTFVPFAWSVTFSHATWIESFTIYVTFHDTGRIPRTNIRRCCCCSAFTMETFLDL